MLFAKENKIWFTTMSFPSLSGLFATLIAAAAIAPDEIPTYKNGKKRHQNFKPQRGGGKKNLYFYKNT